MRLGRFAGAALLASLTLPHAAGARRLTYTDTFQIERCTSRRTRASSISEFKLYAPGVGLMRDAEVELVSVVAP